MLKSETPFQSALERDEIGMIVDALKSKFGNNAMTVARDQLIGAGNDDVRATWEDVIERLAD